MFCHFGLCHTCIITHLIYHLTKICCCLFSFIKIVLCLLYYFFLPIESITFLYTEAGVAEDLSKYDTPKRAAHACISERFPLHSYQRKTLIAFSKRFNRNGLLMHSSISRSNNGTISSFLARIGGTSITCVVKRLYRPVLISPHINRCV